MSRIRKKGAVFNTPNRFLSSHYEPEEAERQAAETRPLSVINERAASIIARNNSPDIPFDQSLNPYRGCEHGCSYCYARPTHEFLGYSAGLDFETRIVARENAAELLEKALAAPSWKPDVLAMSGVTDCYQPIEARLKITRACLEVLRRCRQPVSIVTKNGLVLRDRDLLAELARHNCASVSLSITTLDESLQRRLEPGTVSPRQRLRSVQKLNEAGIPAGIMIAPVIPGLNESEIAAIVEAGAEAGARWMHTIPIRLPGAVEPLFLDWLEREEPGKKARVIDRIRSLRGGALNDARFGSRMVGEGPWSESMRELLRLAVKKAGFEPRPARLTGRHFRRPGLEQLGFSF